MTTGAPEGPDATEGRAWHGSAALALVLLFLAGTFASAAGMHGCPQHHSHAPSPEALTSGTAGAGIALGPAARDGGEARGAADHGPREARGAPGGHGDRDAPAGPTCTCLGDCQAGAPTALHEPALRAVQEPGHLARVGPAADEDVRPDPRPEYFLPYPLGPPVA